MYLLFESVFEYHIDRDGNMLRKQAVGLVSPPASALFLLWNNAAILLFVWYGNTAIDWNITR